MRTTFAANAPRIRPASIVPLTVWPRLSGRVKPCAEKPLSDQLLHDTVSPATTIAIGVVWRGCRRRSCGSIRRAFAVLIIFSGETRDEMSSIRIAQPLIVVAIGAHFALFTALT